MDKDKKRWRGRATRTMPGRNTTGGRRSSRAYATPITRSIYLMHSVKLHRLLLARHSFQTIRNHQPSSLSLSLSSLLRIFQCFLLFVASSPFLSRNVFPSTLCRGQVLLREKGTIFLSLSLWQALNNSIRVISKGGFSRQRWSLATPRWLRDISWCWIEKEEEIDEKSFLPFLSLLDRERQRFLSKLSNPSTINY